MIFVLIGIENECLYPKSTRLIFGLVPWWGANGVGALVYFVSVDECVLMSASFVLEGLGVVRV